MPTETGTTLPMGTAGSPYGGSGGVPTQVLTADAAIAQGDVVIADSTASGRIIETDADPALNEIVGVAMGAASAAGDDILVGLALPGVRYTANIVDGDGDVTGALADDILVIHDLITSADGYWCLDRTGSTQLTYTLGYARQKGTSSDPTQKSGRQTAGVGVTNPRVVFCFISSVFMYDLDT